MNWKWLDPLFVLRPTLFFPCWTLFLAGARLSDGGHNGFRIVWAMVVTGAAMGVIYLINQLRDVGTDRINRKLPYFSQGIFSDRTAWYEVYGLTAFSILGAALVSWGFLAIVLGALLITGGIYNYPPFVWKDHPFWGIAAAVIGGGLAFLAGAEAGGGLRVGSVIGMLPYVFAFAATSLWTEIPDITGDRAMGKRTFAVEYGMLSTLLLGCVGVTVSMVLGMSMGDWVIGWAALLSMPLFFYALVTKQVRWVMLAVKWSIFILALLVGCHYPGFLVLIAGYYLLARVYHLKRFGVIYPSLVTDQENRDAEESS
jgi:4-hydroxybenzoate polyprenyltransferase